MIIEFSFLQKVKQCGQGRHRTVTQPGYCHGHNVLGDVVDFVQLEQPLQYGLIHLLICLMYKDFLYIRQGEPGLIKTLFYHFRDGLYGILVYLVTMHFKEQVATIEIWVVWLINPQQISLLKSIGSGHMGKDASISFCCLNQSSSGSIGINHAVHVMGIWEPW